jgi:hypothetical protein
MNSKKMKMKMKMKRKSKRKRETDQAYCNFIECLHIFYSELSTKYMKYCNILDRNADNLPLNSFLLNLQKQKIQR